MKFVALGATDEIGASCHYLNIEGSGIVLDAGADPEEDGPDSVPRFGIIHREADWYVDHALITHVHHDHIGTLPVLIQQFPHVIAHMAPATRQLADLLLPASVRLQRRRLEEGRNDFDPLFEEEELELYSQLYLTHELEVPFKVTGLRGAAPVTARFFNAGHILGSVGVLLEFEQDGAERRVFYTSDTNVRGQTILPGGRYPEPPIDVLILESTLGGDAEAAATTRTEEEKKFGQALQEVIARGGTALVPVFVMGRAQEVLALIGRFKREGLIPDDVPVYTAGSMRAIADLYDKTRRSTPRLDEDFKVFGVDQKRLPRSQHGVRAALDGPSIHVASSGMMFEPTLSNRLARQLIEDEKNGVLFVGYSKEDSPAHRLQEAAASMNGAQVILSPERGLQPVRCQVERFRLTGHSHRRELIDLVGRLRPEKVLLVHGDAEARAWMADTIRSTHAGVEVLLPQAGEPLEV